MRPEAAGPYAYAAGPESAPGIVFVHGTRMAASYWHVQLRNLSDEFRVVSVDLPGHGLRRAVPFSHREALDTIIRGMAVCSGGAAVVVGHSLGGFLAMDVAAETPERCRGLVLAGCSAKARGVRTLPYRIALRLLPLFSEERLTRLNNGLFRRLYASPLIEPLIASGYGWAATPAAWRAVFGRDHAAALSAFFRGPVLLVNGARDLLFRSGERRFLRTYPQAELCVLRGAAHLCNLDRPDEFNAAVRNFARRVHHDRPLG